mgnify:CR=1 FL=1
MKILLLVIGKTDDEYLITGIKKYVGRIGHYASFEMKEIPDIRNRKTLNEDQQKKAESFLLLQQLPRCLQAAPKLPYYRTRCRNMCSYILCDKGRWRFLFLFSAEIAE